MQAKDQKVHETKGSGPYGAKYSRNKSQLETTPPHPSALSLSHALHHGMRDNACLTSKKCNGRSGCVPSVSVTAWVTVTKRLRPNAIEMGFCKRKSCDLGLSSFPWSKLVLSVIQTLCKEKRRAAYCAIPCRSSRDCLHGRHTQSRSAPAHEHERSLCRASFHLCGHDQIST